MLWYVAGPFVFGIITAGLVIVTASPNGKRWCVHACVAAATLPLAALVSVFLCSFGSQCVEYLHTWAQSGRLFPAPLSRAILKLKPMDIYTVSFLDIQCIALFLFVSYACRLILCHLIDIVRYLKISRRRLTI